MMASLTVAASAMKNRKKTQTKKAPAKSSRSRLTTGYGPATEPPSWFNFTSKSKSGVHMDRRKALEVSAIYCAMTMLMNSVGSMPLHVYRHKGVSGKERLFDHPVARCFGRRPNNFMTPFEFKALIMNHRLLRGDFIAYKMLTNGGDYHLIPLDPERTDVGLDEKYRRWYRYNDPENGPTPFSQDEIFHVKGPFSNGLRGVSIIQAGAKDAFGRAKAADDNASEFYANASVPTGVLEYPLALKKEEIIRLRNNWETMHQGDGNRHRIAIAEQGMKYVQTGITNQDSQFLESRQFEIEEIARWFNMPPHKLKHLLHATFSNIEHQNQEYYDDAVLPNTKIIQESVNADFFTEPGEEDVFSEFLFDSLMITDTKGRYEAHNLAINGGWKKRNEVRAVENLNPIDGLDDILVPLNMQTISQAEKSNDNNVDKPSKDVPAPQDDSLKRSSVKTAFIRVFGESFNKVRSRETKKWDDIQKKGTDSDDINGFYEKLQKFIPEALDTVAVTYAELVGAPAEHARSVLTRFAGQYVADVMPVIRTGQWPNVESLMDGLMEQITRHEKEIKTPGGTV